MAGIYVHIPFCERKCKYCDFYSIVVGDPVKYAEIVDNYLYAIRREAEYYKQRVSDLNVDTIYFGGGTPTLVPSAALGELIQFLRSIFRVSETVEITVEANPNTITSSSLAELKDSGVNRLSLGAQAFQDHLLKRIGRTHSSADIVNSVLAIKQAGIDNISMDLIYGLPEQSMDDWAATLEQVVKLQPTHISCYSLIVEEGTPFYIQEMRGQLNTPGPDVEADMYRQARSYLQENGYIHYEVSNFCQPGKESRHNLHYWRNNSYIGLGSSASGYVEGMRYTNVADISAYIQSWNEGKPLYSLSERIDKDLAMDETMMVGMRLLDGVSDAEFFNRFGKRLFDVYPQQIKTLLGRGLVEFKDDRLRVTERGLYLENLVSAEFLRDRS